MAAVELRLVKLHRFIKGPEMQLKHTATFEKEWRGSEKSGSEVRVINLLRFFLNLLH